MKKRISELRTKSVLLSSLIPSLQQQLRLNIVCSWNDDKTEVVVKTTTMFAKVIKKLTEQFGMEEGTLRLYYDGDTCGQDINPKMLEMKRGRTYRVDATVESLGGGVAV